MASTGEAFGLFWDSENGDRTYSAASFEYWLKKFFTSGVFNGDLQVKATSGMTLEVEAGYTNADGKVKFWNAPFNVTLDAANSTYPRIDTVVIRRDNVNRQITCEKVTGAYSGDTPQPTPPTRNSEIFELVIAQIEVGAGVTGITQSNITDTRPNNELCGYITGTVEELDFSAFTAQFEAYFAEFKRTEMADFSEWEIAQKAAYASWFSTIQQQQIQDKADWDAWYAELQEELHNLPADTAEYLQIQIDEIRDNGTTGSIFHITTTNTELEGKTVTVSCGTEIRTATFDANLECTVIGFKSVGAVTITSTDGIQTATRTLNIDYYSKYEVSIAFWSATVNIQGDDNLKGATITVKDSNDATVATVVLNVITGQGVFNAQKADTYTFNFTFQGTDYSESLVVSQETTYSVSLSTYITKNVTLYSAANDTVSYTDLDGVKTVTTDSTGIGTASITISSGSATNITFTSTVAKNPNSLSDFYSKTVAVDENTTEIKVMPDGVLYWWGYNNTDAGNAHLICDYGGNYTYKALTYNTNSISGTGGSNQWTGICSKSAIDITSYSKLKLYGVHDYDYTHFGVLPSNKTNVSLLYTQQEGAKKADFPTTLSVASLDISSLSGNYWVATLRWLNTNSHTMYALWLE